MNNHELTLPLSTYSFHLPVFECKDSGWFVTHTDPQLDWFGDMYSALYVREEYHNILSSLLELTYRAFEAKEPQTVPRYLPLPVKMGSDISNLSDAKDMKVEDTENSAVPLSRKALLVLESGPFSEQHPPPNPFSQPEYQAAVLNRAVVTGSPGIGKSAFARYVLILRCMQGLPTVLIHQNSRLEFYNGGQFSVHPIDMFIMSGLPANTWIIVDSGLMLVGVPLLVTVSKVFVMQVTSPREDHAQWMKKTSPRPVVVAMKAWSAEELIAARSVQAVEGARETSDDQLRDFVELYGGSAREAYECAADPSGYNGQLECALVNFTLANMRKTLGNQSIPHFPDAGVARIMFRIKKQLSATDGISHLILSLFPEMKEGIRGVVLAPPTAHIQDRLRKHIASLDEQDRNELRRFLLGHSYGKSLAEGIFL